MGHASGNSETAKRRFRPLPISSLSRSAPLGAELRANRDPDAMGCQRSGPWARALASTLGAACV